MADFRLRINMAGAVSAGAHTAGVLGFMIEALDERYAAKDAGVAVPVLESKIKNYLQGTVGEVHGAISSGLVQRLVTSNGRVALA